MYWICSFVLILFYRISWTILSQHYCLNGQRKRDNSKSTVDRRLVSSLFDEGRKRIIDWEQKGWKDRTSDKSWWHIIRQRNDYPFPLCTEIDFLSFEFSLSKRQEFFVLSFLSLSQFCLLVDCLKSIKENEFGCEKHQNSIIQSTKPTNQQKWNPSPSSSSWSFSWPSPCRWSLPNSVAVCQSVVDPSVAQSVVEATVDKHQYYSADL